MSEYCRRYHTVRNYSSSLRYHRKERKNIVYDHYRLERSVRSFSLDREDIASRHATSSCVTASAHSSNFDLRSYDLAEIDTDGTFVFLFPRVIVEEADAREARTFVEGSTTDELYIIPPLNPEGNLIVCREVLVFTGILNIYDVRLDEVPWVNAEVPASFGFVSKTEPREILRFWDLGCAGP